MRRASRRPTVRGAVLTAIVIASALAGCITDGDQGRIAMYVKDAPTDEFRHINITFGAAEVHAASEGPWIQIANGTKTVDLLAFSDDGSRSFLGMAEVGAGRYTQVRIHVESAVGVRSDGEEVPITVTNGQARFVRAFNVSADTTTRLVLDLDLDKAIVATGQGYRMNPVIGKVEVIEDSSGDETSVPDTETTPTDVPPNGTVGNGILTTYVKDAPTDEFREIWLSFTRVFVHEAGTEGVPGGGNDTSENITMGNDTSANDTAGNDTAGGNGTSDNATAGGDNTTSGNDTTNTTGPNGTSWITVYDGNRSVNLLNFSDDGAKAFLGDATLAPGRYTQVRLEITAAWAIREDGTRVNITVTNAEAKAVRSFAIDDGRTTQIVIDLDLDRSLHRTGPPGSDEWRLTPVIGNIDANEVDDDPRTDRPDSADGT